MPKAVGFDESGGVDVLHVVESARPVPGRGQVLVRVKAAGINPGEGKIRSGALSQMFPATFPSGQGSDLAGVVEELGQGGGGAGGGRASGFAVSDEVIGFANNRASHAELVVVEAADLVHKPAGVSWEAAGPLFGAGTTAYAMVRAAPLREADTGLGS